MKRREKTSISIMKIICVSIILIFLSGMGVMAVTTQINNVKITLSSGYEMTVFTTKTKISEILEENNIILTEEERVIPGLDEELTEDRAVTITDKSEQEIQVAKISENGTETSLDEILKNYSPIVEKIIVEQETIPYETITKDASSGSTDTKNKILQEGKDGLKEVTYKVKYQNDIEIEKIKLSETIITEPVSKIVQVQKVATSRSTTTAKTSTKTTTSTAIYKVTAYCACSKCCGSHANGYTASGTKATEGITVAAPANFSFGTKLSINGSTYTVEDRGGSITGNRIDVYVNSHSEALAWGVKYLPVSVIQ